MIISYFESCSNLKEVDDRLRCHSKAIIEKPAKRLSKVLLNYF